MSYNAITALQAASFASTFPAAMQLDVYGNPIVAAERSLLASLADVSAGQM